MITHSEMMKIYRKIREMNAKAFFSLEGTRYKLAINRYIHARDPENHRVPWTQAFGSKLPHDVLNTYKITEIKILRENQVINFKNLKEFLKWLR